MTMTIPMILISIPILGLMIVDTILYILYGKRAAGQKKQTFWMAVITPSGFYSAYIVMRSKHGK